MESSYGEIRTNKQPLTPSKMNALTKSLKKLRKLSLALFSLCTLSLVAKETPNLVIILTDDQGYADVGFNGCTDIPLRNQL